jgi:NADH:ubiquinone reductase (H+-translocating)
MNPRETGHRIVIVGGGAGGLELATRLGNTLGRRKKATVVLVDHSLSHVWKPLLHEVAAGTLTSPEDRVDYLAHARTHQFQFRLGRMSGLDRRRRQVRLMPVPDPAGGEQIPERTISYDTLVLAVGSTSNDYGIPGVREHCMFLDNREQAERFQRHLFHRSLRAQVQTEPLSEGDLCVAIIGAGATGVELAAELHHAAERLAVYGLDRISPERGLRLVLIEAAEQVLPALPLRLARATERELLRIGVTLHKGKRVSRVTEQGVYTQDGLFVASRIKVWAAGIQAPEFLRDLDGLETNRLHQLVVHRTLQSTRDGNIFALGDCSSCPQGEGRPPVPPRAQAAHQQATLLAGNLARRLEGKPPLTYVYRDYGSLISLSRYTTVGNLMGNLTGDVMIEGRFARMVYRSLHRMHQVALHGGFHTMLIVLADFVTRSGRSRLKLH